MAQIIAIWIDILEQRVTKGDYVLSMGDNTSVMGWLMRSNFRQNDESDCSWSAKQQPGRHFASLTLSSDICLYKQCLKGSYNQVADSLSRDSYYIPPKAPKYFLHSVIPHQLPQNYCIKPLPREISSFIM